MGVQIYWFSTSLRSSFSQVWRCAVEMELSKVKGDKEGKRWPGFRVEMGWYYGISRVCVGVQCLSGVEAGFWNILRTA